VVDLDVVVGIHPVCVVCIKQTNLAQVLVTLTYLLPFALPSTCVPELDRLSLLLKSGGPACPCVEVVELAALQAELKHWHGFSPAGLSYRLRNHQPILEFASFAMGRMYSVLFVLFE
jgi:hypothetical protein